MKYTNFDEFTFRHSVEKALRKVHAILGTEKLNVRLASDDPQHKDYNDKFALAEFLTNTSVAAQLTVLEQLGLTATQLQTLMQWVHDEQQTVTLHFQAEDGCSFLKEQDVEVGGNTVEIVNETTTQTSSSSSSFFGSSSSNNSNTKETMESRKHRVVTKIKEYHWKVYVSYKLKVYKGNYATPPSTFTPEQVSQHVLELQSRHASTILITSGGQATSPVRRGPGAGTHKSVPPIAEKTVHPAVEVALTWLVQTLQPRPATTTTTATAASPSRPMSSPQRSTSASTATSDASSIQTPDSILEEESKVPGTENQAIVLAQFGIDRSRPTCRTPRRNEAIQTAMEFHQSLVHWLLSVLNFFLDRLEKEILAKHNPAKHQAPSSDASNDKSAAAKLEPNTKCQMVGLEKDPSFNNKYVVVREYLAAADRYRVEPINPSDGLPPSLTIKKANLKRDVSCSSIHSSGGAPMAAGPRLSRVSVEDVFVPTLPLFWNGKVFSMPDANALLQGQAQSIQQAFDVQIAKVFPPRQVAKLATQAEAKILLLCTHWLNLIEQYQNGVNSIEHMLRQQLVHAIGKEVQASDFDAFVRFHLSKKLLAPAYAPKPFTYAVRRPQQYPDGMVSIESTFPPMSSRGTPSIQTMVRHVQGGEDQPSIYIPINASTSIEITGDRYLHGWMQHQFESESVEAATAPAQYQLVARARQFSNFLLVVGNMASSNTLDPKAAIILHNKDEVMIPLLTNVLPSSKEFKDAIASLSPEQQAFCRAFRGMQLESSVFGICIIQLKPQLEQLLGLPNKALTKEIQLTQDLMQLFVEYQIPSDLLSFDDDDLEEGGEGEQGDSNTLARSRGTRKLAAVKAHVKNVVTVIEAEKEKQFSEEERKAEMRAEMKYKPDRKGTDADEISDDGEEEDADIFPDQGTLSSSMVGQVSISSIKMKAPPGRRRLVATAASPPMAMAAVPPTNAMRATEAFMSKSQPIPGLRTTNLPDPISPKISTNSFDTSTTSTTLVAEDFTLVPKLLDDKLDKYDTDHALRSTVLTAASTWSRRRQENLLVTPQTTELDPEEVERETNKAFDLLDALSRSGTLPIACAELHVIVAVSHCFENDVMGSVIQDNINPIEKIERSTLLIGSTIYGQACNNLLANSEQEERLAKTFPSLFISEF
ncbi:hypothetical protein ACA910_002925 [Epithemia clementina (nom. ined.)]